MFNSVATWPTCLRPRLTRSRPRRIGCSTRRSSGSRSSPRPLRERRNHRGPLKPATRAAVATPWRPAPRAVSDAAACIASVLIVGEAERGEAERLVGAHCATINDEDPLAPVVVAGRLAQPVVVSSGREAGEFFGTYGRVKRGR
jgi:hypothetical protein